MRAVQTFPCVKSVIQTWATHHALTRHIYLLAEGKSNTGVDSFNKSPEECFFLHRKVVDIYEWERRLALQRERRKPECGEENKLPECVCVESTWLHTHSASLTQTPWPISGESCPKMTLPVTDSPESIPNFERGTFWFLSCTGFGKKKKKCKNSHSTLDLYLFHLLWQ